MIAALTGRLVSKAPAQIVLDVHGVGYEVFIPLSTFFALPGVGDTISLHIHTHMRENTLQLFGFLTPLEKDTFLLLTSIPGIGGKLALSALSALRIEDLLQAITANDLETLTTIPGIGKKSASRITLELREKVARLNRIDLPTEPGKTMVHKEHVQDDAISALVNLGYRAQDVKDTVKRVLMESGGQLPLADLIRASLKVLAKN